MTPFQDSVPSWVDSKCNATASYGLGLPASWETKKALPTAVGSAEWNSTYSNARSSMIKSNQLFLILGKESKEGINFVKLWL